MWRAKEALSAVYDRRGTQLWSFARRMGLDAADAEDVVQEAFLRASRHATDVRDLDAWLFRSVRNLTIDRHRSTRRAALANWRLRNPTPPDDDLRIVLWQAVDDLPERQRLVVYLRFRADLDFRRIASVLEISEAGARSNLARALDTLRKVVDQA
jgi:RNA polymerase sigma-70 factor (ECF subfamily)